MRHLAVYAASRGAGIIVQERTSSSTNASPSTPASAPRCRRSQASYARDFAEERRTRSTAAAAVWARCTTVASSTSLKPPSLSKRRTRAERASVETRKRGLEPRVRRGVEAEQTASARPAPPDLHILPGPPPAAYPASVIESSRDSGDETGWYVMNGDGSGVRRFEWEPGARASDGSHTYSS